MMPFDPIEPQVNINDYLKTLTQQVGQDSVTYANGTTSSPSKPRSQFTLPKIGLASRVFLDFDFAYDITVGTGAGSVAADKRGPYQLTKTVKLTVNGKVGWYNVSGWGTYIIDAREDRHSFPQDAPGTVYTTAPTDVASNIFDYPVAADGTGHWQLEIPIIAKRNNPLSMLLLNNDQTTVVVEVEHNTLDHYASFTGTAAATGTLTITCTLEYFDIPEAGVFQQFFVPMLGFGHWFFEVEQAITSKGANANKVIADTHDTYLGIFHTLILNGVLNTDDVDNVRLKLNTNQTLRDNTARRQLRDQRDKWGKDLPLYGWDLFSEGNLKDAVNGDAYTAIESFIDVNSGATLGSDARIITTFEKLVSLT